MRQALRLLLPLTLSGLAACSLQPSLPKATSASPDSLIGSQWEATELYGQPIDGKAPTLVFTSDRSHGYAGCNQFFSQLELQEDSFRLSRIGSTRMSCEPHRNQLEQTYLRGLGKVRRAQRQGEDLILLDETGTPVVRFRPLPDMPLPVN